MPTFRVDFVKKDKFFVGLRAPDTLIYPNDYEEAAIIIVDDYGESFEVCNTIDHYWWENSEVISRPENGPRRSMSVGDVVHSLADMNAWRCESVGWKQIMKGGKNI